jgi:hypothetical protein
MKKIDLKKIIAAKKLDVKKVALVLFPGHKHPKLALDRVLSGAGVLDANQISVFSLYSGLPIAELYSGADWSSRIEGAKHILLSGDYRAELDTSNWTTKLFHNDSLFHEFIIHSSSIGLGEYIDRLNLEISKQK